MSLVSYRDVNDFQYITIKLSDGEYFGEFSSMRIDRKTIPYGLYAYDIRHDEESWFAELKKFVLVNHFGTFVTRTEIPDADKGRHVESAIVEPISGNNIDYFMKLLEMKNSDYQAFVQALIAIETGIRDDNRLNDLYQQYMSSDTWNLINDRFYEHDGRIT